jgi:tight adherence protein C
MTIDPDLLVMAGLGAMSLGLLALGLSRNTQYSRLNRRLQILAPRRAVARPAQGGIDGMERVVLFGQADRDEVQTLLRCAGFHGTGAAATFGLLRIGAALLLAVLGAVITWRAGHWVGLGRLGPFACFLAALIGSKMVLSMLVASRLRQVRRELPFVLDLLLLMLESGVGLDQCFRQIAQLDSGGMRVIGKVNVQLVDDLQNGMSYEAALDRWADRVAVPGARELSSLFRQSLLYGTELGPALHIFTPPATPSGARPRRSRW